MNTFNSPEEAKNMINKQIEKSGIICPKNLEEMALSQVG